MLKKLRAKFICITMVIVAVMLCVVFALVYHFTSRNLEEESLQMMKRVSAGAPFKAPPGSREDHLQFPYFILSVTVDGEITVRENDYFDLSDAAYLRELADNALSNKETTGTLTEYKLRFSRQNTPREQLLIFADISSEVTILRNLIISSLFIGLACLTAFFLVSMLLARWTVKPVEKAWRQQKQFVADASHELKTPLTVILTNAELLKDPQCTETTRQQSSKSILTMSYQMRGLVESLLKLARVDDGSAQMQIEKLDLSSLASDALLPFDPLYFEQGLELQSDICPDISVKGSATHLKQVVEILLDNAQKYSEPGSTVHVELRKAGAHCLLQVTNQGDELSKEDLKNIFKRFYRVDKVRSMNHSYGLGLSIAQGIIEIHKGKIWAESDHGRNVFSVQLPLA